MWPRRGKARGAAGGRADVGHLERSLFNTKHRGVSSQTKHIYYKLYYYHSYCYVI